MTNSEEKRYKIKKIEEYNSQISSMKSEKIKNAIVTAVFAIGTVVLLSSSCVYGNLIELAFGVGSGAISIFGLIYQSETKKHIKKLENEKNQLLDSNNNKNIKRSYR